MIRIVARSTLVLLASAVAGSLVIFLLLRLLGGDIATVILGHTANPEALAALRVDLGLQRSWGAQYLDWLGGLVRGDLGHSYAARYDIFGEILARLPVTFGLALGSMLLASVFALAAGTYSAINVRRLRGSLVDVTTQLGIAVPTFWAGLLLIMLFSIRLGWLPAGGYVPWSQSPAGALRSLVLPVVALAIPIAAIFTRYVRSAMLDVLTEDFIRTAMAKGRTLRGAALVHGVRNAAVPLVTVGTLQLGALFAGAVVVENVFTLPGLGRLLVTAINGREAIVVQSTAFVILLLVLVMNFLMDLSYGVLDPRIRDAERRGAHA